VVLSVVFVLFVLVVLFVATTAVQTPHLLVAEFHVYVYPDNEKQSAEGNVDGSVAVQVALTVVQTY
jgi:hypothetical protein